MLARWSIFLAVFAAVPLLGAYAQPPAPKSDSPRKLKIVLVSGSLEYKSDETLAELQKFLEEKYPIECRRAFRKADDDLPGLDALKDCDLAIFFTRRLTIDGAQLQQVKDFLKSGKPIIGIRSASHGFQKFLEMDKEIFGGDYNNHYKVGPKCEVKISEKARDNPVLKGFEPYSTSSSLYKNANLAKDVTVLLTGTIPDHTEPIAWTREVNKTRIFYTSLGSPEDFKNPNFRTLIVNAIHWTTGK